MFRLPSEIKRIFEVLEGDGHQVYLVGGSVRDALLGLEPEDWDLASDAAPERVAELFDVASFQGDRYGVVKVKVKALEAEVAAMRIDGVYSDRRRPDTVTFTDDIKKDLARRDFTINAMAYHPATGLIDPYGGKKDIDQKLIRMVGDPIVRLAEDPLRILRGLRLAGQLDFDVERATFDAMKENAPHLTEISMDRRRGEFERLLVTKQTGKALRMCAAADVLPALFGDCYPPKGRQSMGDLSVLLQEIDQSRPRVDLRMALLLLCFDKKKARKAIRDLEFDRETTRRLEASLDLLDELYFSTEKYLLKRFIYLNGMDIYEFLESLAKQHRDVYDVPGYRIESRYYLLDHIKKSREPLFLEDLAINGDDLVEAGIVTGEQVGEMLQMLLDVAHRLPGLNTKKKLLQRAKMLKNPIRAKLRNIYFIK